MLRFFLCLESLFLFLPSISATAAVEQRIRPNASVISTNLSHLQIWDLCQDSLGYMWIATSRGLNRYNGYEYKQFFHNKQDLSSLDNDMIYSLYLDSRHRLWVGTSAGVNRYDFTNDLFVRYEAPFASVYDFLEDADGTIWIATSSGVGQVAPDRNCVTMDTSPLVSSTNINFLQTDKTGKIWAGTNKGLAYYNQDSKWGPVEGTIPIPDKKRIRCVCPDPQGIFMVGTSSGIAFFDPAAGRFIKSPQLLAADKTLNSASIHFIREIAPLVYLIGTSANGLFLYDALRQNLRHNPVEYTDPMNSKELLCCNADHQGNIWIGSFDKGVAVYTQHNFFNCRPRLNNTFKGTFTTRIVEDKYHNLWVGTRYNGLYHYNSNNQIRKYDSSNSRIFKDNSNLIEELFIDTKNRLWIVCAEEIAVGTFSESGDISILRSIPLSGTTGAATVTEDNEGNIWFGLLSGLFVIRGGAIDGQFENICTPNVPRVYRLQSGEIIFSVYGDGIYKVENNMGITKIDMKTPETVAIARHCVDIFEDTHHRIWLGSYNEGTMYIQGDSCRTFSMADGLPCNDITCIKADLNGNIWMSTAHGLSRIGSDMSIANYFDYDGTTGNLYHEKGGLLHSDGTLIFTGNHGLTIFDPRLIARNSNPPRIVIEDLKIHNESVHPGEKGSILENNISFSDKIILNYKHSVLTIDYSGIDFTTPQKLTYAYKLEGFDQHWNYVGDHRRATYSNLSPGDYLFSVKAFNSDGLESVSPATFRIEVKPAPWATWWAWTIYIGLFGIALFGFIRLWTKIKLQKHHLEMEANERVREREITEMKMTFYTNISHELRTPLTLITAPIQQLSEYIVPDSTEGQLLQTISRNGQRLHRLMDQLLDFRRMEDGILILQTRPGDIIKELSFIIDIYRSTATHKKIEILFSAHSALLEMWYDSDKIEKIMHNLLSNAMKYTHEKGRITIQTREISMLDIQSRYADIPLSEDRHIEISVSDNGPGVSPDKLGELFVRYRQITSPTGFQPDYAGTGIGLHYTKRLIEVHHGAIIAELPPEGGLKFSFVLPMQTTYSPTERIDETSIQKSPFSTDDVADADTPQTGTTSGSHKHTILIAEDNLELMAYFRLMLGQKYNIIEAVNGTRAWDSLQNDYTDLVLSDVVMPGLSGYELCANIKNHPALSHIPVILLTAKTSMPEQIEGLSQGADAYICKPFNVEFLLLTIENQLRNREKLRLFYSTPQSEIEHKEIPVLLNMLDRTFMNNLMELLEKEMSNPNMNIDDIAREMAFSRTSFYRKMKGLTDMAPADFLRNYRLKRAAEMILEGSWTLYEVADKTGFGNYSHFSVLFKKHFNVTPKRYKEERE